MSKFILRFVLLLSITNTSVVAADLSNKTINGIVGPLPLKLLWIIDRLNLQESRKSNLPLIHNRLLLYGPPGNGKTLLARKVAELTNRILIKVDGPSIVTRFQGSGAEKIAQFFNDALEMANSYSMNVVIFIDEIDAIASNVDNDFRADHKAALQQLWLEMDKYKHDPRIFIIVATNHIKKLDATFLDRFGNNAIELKNPSAKTRRLVLAHYLKAHTLELEQSLLDDLVKQSKGLSIRSLEDLVADISMVAQMCNQGIVTHKIALETLADIKNKFKRYESEDEKRKKLEKINLHVGIVHASFGTVLNIFQLFALAMGIAHPQLLMRSPHR